MAANVLLFTLVSECDIIIFRHYTTFHALHVGYLRHAFCSLHVLYKFCYAACHDSCVELNLRTPKSLIRLLHKTSFE